MPHINKSHDLCSEVFVVYKDKVLLRKHDKLKIWLGVGGHIEPDEDPCEAALREVKEEVGLDVQLYDDSPKEFNDKDLRLLPRPAHLSRHRITDTHEHTAFVFYARSNTDKLKLSDTEKTNDCRWFSIKELDDIKDIRAEIKHYAKEALMLLSDR